jgi:hypothetical protein
VGKRPGGHCCISFVEQSNVSQHYIDFDYHFSTKTTPVSPLGGPRLRTFCREIECPWGLH